MNDLTIISRLTVLCELISECLELANFPTEIRKVGNILIV